MQINVIKFLICVMITSCCLVTQSYALQVNQVIRKTDKTTREDSDKQEDLNRLSLRKKAQGALSGQSFYIHTPIICTGDAKTKTQDITNKSRISVSDMLNSAVTLLTVFEITKAHLDISLTLYRRGSFITSNSVRYHALDELQRYPDAVVKDSVDDAFKSVYYVRYVMLPMLKPFLTDTDYKTVLQALNFLKSPDQDKLQYRYYASVVLKIKKILDASYLGVLSEYKAEYKTDLSDVQIKMLVSIRLLNESWAAYQNATSCPYYTTLTDPSADPYDYDLPDYHDSYVMGYGLYKRAEFLIESNILGARGLTLADRLTIAKTLAEFKKIYPSIIKQDALTTAVSNIVLLLNETKAVLKKNFFKR